MNKTKGCLIANFATVPKEIFLSEAYRAFGDALFLSLAETTIEFASHDPQRAREIIALGFEAMWHALHEADA
ncbi:TetR family transcriptional regulator [Klebsiella pneumoniae]|nr:TetR family transcriptional regulator [Klebsiella pneumoniae]